MDQSHQIDKKIQRTSEVSREDSIKVGEVEMSPLEAGLRAFVEGEEGLTMIPVGREEQEVLADQIIKLLNEGRDLDGSGLSRENALW